MATTTSSVSDFLANFGGGARPNRFRVTLHTPPALATPLPKLPFLCHASSIPSSTLGFAPLSYMGRTVKIAGDKEYDDWNVTIYNDRTFDLRNFFEKWMNGILGNVKNVTIFDENPINYYGSADVEQLDRKENVIQTYTMKDIFPTSVAEIELNFDSNNVVEEFQVTFAINWWENQSSTDFTQQSA